jgi:hypothetical protein
LASPKSSPREKTSIFIPRTPSFGEGRVRLFKQKALLFAEEGFHLVSFLCFYTIRLSSSGNIADGNN